MTGTFHGNRFNRRILFYHLFAVLIVLTATLIAASLLLKISEAQIHEEQLQKSLDANYSLILNAVIEDDEKAQQRLNDLSRNENISLICINQPSTPLYSIKAWPSGDVAECNGGEGTEVTWGVPAIESEEDRRGGDPPLPSVQEGEEADGK